jgi:hypothetical protein
MSRTDWKPSVIDRARLAGRSPRETPNYRLAAEVRAINARLAQLPTESQRELQDDWLASWAELQRQLESARDDTEQRFDLIKSWSGHWLERLG